MLCTTFRFLTRSFFLLFVCGTSFLDDNNLTSLPTEIGLLSRLKAFYLGKCVWWNCNDHDLRCKIVIVFPACPWILWHDAYTGDCLQCAFVDGNILRSIPTEIGLISKLELLRLRKCFQYKLSDCHICCIIRNNLNWICACPRIL